MRWFRRHSTAGRPSVTTKDVTLGLYLAALYTAGVSENDAFDATSPEVSVETCRQLCVLLFDGFPAEATDEGLRAMAALGWAALEATKAAALAWANQEQAIHVRLWGPPDAEGGSLPLMDHLLRLADESAALAFCAMMDRPLWQAFLYLYNRGIVAEGHRTNAEMKASAGRGLN